MAGSHRSGADRQWQDELRTLDADVASGVLSAEDYRRRRDELLVSASDRANSATATPDLPGPGAADPFPPPFRWGGNPPPAAAHGWTEEAAATAVTQVIDRRRIAAMAQRPDPGERTQVINRAVVDRADAPNYGPGLPPWWNPGAVAREPEVPRVASADDVFDESAPPPYRLVTATLLVLLVVGIALALT